MKHIWLMTAIFCCIGCGKTSESSRNAFPEPNPGLSTKLSQAVLEAKHHPPCNSIIPFEWANGRPVPSGRKSPKKFRIFFFAVTGTPGIPPTLYSPGGESVVDIDTGKPAECSMSSAGGKELSRQVWRKDLGRRSPFEVEALLNKLMSKTEEIAALYASERSLTSAEKKQTAEYIELFEQGSEPDLLPYYYHLNPDFWEWLRQAAGRSIPAPASH